jgi:hypothetical protein
MIFSGEEAFQLAQVLVLQVCQYELGDLALACKFAESFPLPFFTALDQLREEVEAGAQTAISEVALARCFCPILTTLAFGGEGDVCQLAADRLTTEGINAVFLSGRIGERLQALELARARLDADPGSFDLAIIKTFVQSVLTRSITQGVGCEEETSDDGSDCAEARELACVAFLRLLNFWPQIAEFLGFIHEAITTLSAVFGLPEVYPAEYDQLCVHLGAICSDDVIANEEEEEG